MSRCPFHDRLEPYLADRLGDADQAILVAHIPDCQYCQSELETLTDADQAIFAAHTPDCQGCQRELGTRTDAEWTSAWASGPVGSRDTVLPGPREEFLKRLKQLAPEAGAARRWLRHSRRTSRDTRSRRSWAAGAWASSTRRGKSA